MKYLNNIIALCVGVVCFYAVVNFLKAQKIQPTEIIVEVEAIVPKDDIFYVYYLQEGVKNWSDEYSTFLRIKGSNVAQNLKFTIPIDKKIEKIRIDIGANKKQLPMQINAISVYSEIDKINLTDSIHSLFNFNVYTTHENGTYYTKVVEGRYDPFLISNNYLEPTLNRLRTPDRMLSNKWVYLFSFIFSIAIVITLMYKLKQIEISYFSIAFNFFIIAPLFVQIMGIQLQVEDLEKRELSKWPNIDPIIDFPKNFETYYNDNFGLRPQMIAIAGKIKTNIFRSSPKPDLVQFGKDKFLFYNSLEDEIFESYTQNNLLSQVDLEKYYKIFKERTDSLSKKGVTYVKGFWPNKHTIYSKNLPAGMSMQIKGDESLADQIVTYFNSKEEQFFDVRQSMLDNSKEKLLYRKFDTHWNADGAYIGYKAFCEQTYSILGLTPVPENKFSIIYDEVESGDLTKQMGVDNIWGYDELNPNYTLKDMDLNYVVVKDSRFPIGSILTKNPNAANKKKVLIFRDSFTSQLVQFISLHYEEVVYLNQVYNENIIDIYNPDVVISCRVERYMRTM